MIEHSVPALQIDTRPLLAEALIPEDLLSHDFKFIRDVASQKHTEAKSGKA
jgi:hypothetical protein